MRIIPRRVVMFVGVVFISQGAWLFRDVIVCLQSKDAILFFYFYADSFGFRKYESIKDVAYLDEVFN